MDQIDTMANATSDQLNKDIDACMLADRFYLKKKLADLTKLAGKSEYINKNKELESLVEESFALVEQRKQLAPDTSYPEALPISQKRDEIAEAILKHQVVVIAGETGSGKTTQIPKICLDVGRGIAGKIGHTQPRRLAARTVAARLAEELNVSLGEQVGCQIRFSDQSNQHTLIKLMTDGILLAETQQDRFLNAYDTIIIDEAHERSLNIDFLLGYLKQLLPKRPDLKVIITSATIDLKRFSKHFSNAPVIEVSGRTYPVDVLYQPATEVADNNKNTDPKSVSGAEITDGLAINIVSAVDRIRDFPRRNGPDDILIFLSGEKDIRDISKVLKQQQYRHTEILPLYGRLSNADQNKVFQSHTGQRIILATNVAETSVTVPGIRYVIDPGLARISRYSVRSKVQQLPIEPISQASANQRKGRCGRVADGVCVRLYSEDDFNNRPEFTDPEISRTNLASVILRMLNLRLGSIEAFPFIDKPHSRSIKDGYHLLLELGAVDQRRSITELGRQLARFPLDPRIARMVIAAAGQGCIKEVIIIASALAIQDPRERPHNSRQLADEKHRVFADPDSDFISLVNLWNEVEEQRQTLTRNQFGKYCKRQFLSYLRVGEWRATHRQLLLLCRELSFSLNQQPADYGAIHRSVLTGLLGYIGEKQEKNEYQGTRNRRFHIFPGSNLFKKTPKWIVAFELVETSRLYARMAAKIDPAWVEPLAKTLVKKQYSEPHWQKKRGQVVAFEQVSLYGLVIVSRRSVDFGRIDAQQAREIFIRSALVEGLLETRLDFFKQNQQLIADIEALEDKSRRRDILVDDDSIFRFYHDRIPEHVCSLNTLTKWLKKSKLGHTLILTQDYLMQHCAARVNIEQFPDEWQQGETSLKLTYEFNPGRDDDGVSLEVPLALLNQISGKRLQWLVPGMLRDKCIALVKALPKAMRKNFVPVPGFVDQALAELEPCDQALTSCLGRALKRLTGIEVAVKQWDVTALDNYHLMNIRVIDDKGIVLGQGRDLVTLRKKLGHSVDACMTKVNRASVERANITCWDFGALDQAVEVEQGGIALKAYPALVEKAGLLNIELSDNKAKARRLSRRGILQLLMLATSDQYKYVTKQIAGSAQLLLYFARLGSKRELTEDLLRAIYQRTFLDNQNLPMNKPEFDDLLKTRKQHVISLANDTIEQVTEILKLRHKISANIANQNAIASGFVFSDIQHQLENLFEAGFIFRVPWQHLKNYPRYLKAIQLRIDKIQGQLQREKTYCEQLQQFWQQYEVLKKQYQNQALSEEPLTRLRWLFEEYRVSLYAQGLGTSEPVSRKRLEKLFSQIEM